MRALRAGIGINLVTNYTSSESLGMDIENIFTYSLCLPNGKPRSQLNWGHGLNCLGQRGQRRLFSDLVCVALFWGNFNPNIKNSFKLIFFIFDLVFCSVYQCGLPYHFTPDWCFCISCCALLPRSIKAELALVLLLLWAWAPPPQGGGRCFMETALFTWFSSAWFISLLQLQKFARK